MTKLSGIYGFQIHLTVCAYGPWGFHFKTKKILFPKLCSEPINYLGVGSASINFKTSPGYFNTQPELRVDCTLRGNKCQEKHCFSAHHNIKNRNQTETDKAGVLAINKQINKSSAMWRKYESNDHITLEFIMVKNKNKAQGLFPKQLNQNMAEWELFIEIFSDDSNVQHRVSKGNWRIWWMGFFKCISTNRIKTFLDLESLEHGASLKGKECSYTQSTLEWVHPGQKNDDLRGQVLVVQLYSTLCDPMDCSPPGSSVHGIPRQEYWNGLPFPSPGDLPDSGIEPRSPALQADSLLSEPWGNHGSWPQLQGMEMPEHCDTGNEVVGEQHGRKSCS